MTHPYRSQPDRAFWERLVASSPWSQVDLAPAGAPTLTADTRIGTAGSCFAANLVRWMPRLGLTPFVTEDAPSYFTDEEVAAHHYRDFSARYGNIYTVRQLRQLVEQALGDCDAIDEMAEADGAVFDLLRPHVRPGGFDSLDEARNDRRFHLGCVRRLLSECDVFVFTLGLTEGWVHAESGVVYPVCPGTVAGEFHPEVHRPVNFGYPEILDDLTWTMDRIARVNPDVHWIITVSPVALVATHTQENVLVASTYSKSVLRAVCGAIDATRPDVTYFPSYEIIAAPQSFGQYLSSNLREVTERGVAHVIDVFGRTFLDRTSTDGLPEASSVPHHANGDDTFQVARRVLEAQCDELMNDPG